jgi:hypothetical protein
MSGGGDMKLVRLGILATLLISGSFPLLAQMVAPVRSGYVHYVEGSVFIDDKAIVEPITGQFPAVAEGSLIRTEQGRAEVLMNPGVTFRLGENSSAQMLMTAFADTRVQLLKGSSTVHIIERLKDTNLSLAVGEAQIVFDKAGFMHVDAEPARIKVYTGQANVRLGGKLFVVTSGKALDFANGATATLQGFDKDQTTALDRWSMRRSEVLAQANANAARNGSGSVNCFIGQPCPPGWTWDPKFGMMVYIPLTKVLCDPFLGFCYYSTRGIQEVATRPVSLPPAGGDSWNPGRMAPTSTGYSGTGAVAASTASAPSAGTGSSAASSASGGTVGQGSASGSRGR